MERRNRPSRIKEQFNDHNGRLAEVGKTKSQEALLRHNELAQHKCRTRISLTPVRGRGEAGFLLSQELLIHKRGNPGFPTLNHLMTTHFSMAPGMETEWLFADLTDFLSFLYTYGLAV
jgi:hypothetical protein